MSEPHETSPKPRLLGVSVLGAVVGAIIGAIVAVNIAIYLGPDQGYESSIGDLFEANAIVGVLTILALVGGPVVGIVVARRAAQKRT